MTEFWRGWIGRLLGNRFRLSQLLHATESSAVFVAEDEKDDEKETDRLAVKLLRADGSATDRQLDTWEAAKRLSHPHLAKLFHAGSSEFGGVQIIYAVMELAEENLGHVLPERPLTGQEAWQMLDPVVQALRYLHENGWTHGGVKPANVLATADVIRLPLDGVKRTGSPVGAPATTPYDPPEYVDGSFHPAGDVWALGVTLVEALTQYPPRWGPQWALPRIPDEFSVLVRGCLRKEPAERVTLEQVEDLLPGRPARRETKAPTAKAAVVAATIAVLGVSAAILAPKVMSRNTAPATVLEKIPKAPAVTASEVAPNQAPLVKQVLPRVSETARRTLRGTVRVRVTAFVNKKGSVTRVEYLDKGPSGYFAGAALQAARRWEFLPAIVDGKPMDSVWLLTFEFTSQGTTMLPARFKP